ncbi:MAG: hypothetical protein AAB701_03270 [Patescibacteria group bacterium]
MAQQSARSQTTGALFFIVTMIIVIGVALLFLVPGSPFRPEASEPGGATTTFNAPQQAEFRDGQVGNISGNKVTVDEPNGGSFTFVLTDEVIIRGLNDNTFEIVSRDRLDKGDFVSVFYQNTESAQRVSRVDIVREQ